MIQNTSNAINEWQVKKKSKQEVVLHMLHREKKRVARHCGIYQNLLDWEQQINATNDYCRLIASENP